jgi:hypothetical protein
MNITSKRSIISILVGIIVGLLVFIFLRPACWGPLIGGFVTVVFAKVSSPKQGALVGTIVLAPIGLYSCLQTALTHQFADDPVKLFANILGLVLAFLLFCGVGALYGLILGKLFQLTKKNKIVF